MCTLNGLCSSYSDGVIVPGLALGFATSEGSSCKHGNVDYESKCTVILLRYGHTGKLRLYGFILYIVIIGIIVILSLLFALRCVTVT